VLDRAELQPVAISLPINIKGEAYKIERDIKFPQEGLNGVDFGLVSIRIQGGGRRHSLQDVYNENILCIGSEWSWKLLKQGFGRTCLSRDGFCV